MFITYFPELIAGPIVRASVFLPQMTRSLRPSLARIAVGAQIVLLGVTKKLLIADRLAPLPDAVFRNPALYSQTTVISALIAYSLQIYCDFSGYSDIAIGVSRIIGFDLPENFNMPYAATSITEFWRRWHITLSQWLRDYVYIPFGGNRRGKLRTYVNLMATMLLGGLWHGASWNFVIWGGLHGLSLSVHKIWDGRGWRLPAPAAWFITYSFVCFAWIFFRAQSLGDSVVVIRKVLGLASGGIQWVYSPLLELIPLIVVAHLIGLGTAKVATLSSSKRRVRPPRWLAPVFAGNGERLAVRPHNAAGLYCLLPVPSLAGGFVIGLWSIALYLFAALNTSPFIYFQF
jgi:alginate O-acetyltransferase complex protein AlgI